MTNLKRVLISAFVTLFCIGSFYLPAFSATLILEDGQLMGATGIDVNGELYDVLFLDGTAEELFSTDGEYTFTFTNKSESDAALEALEEQVLIGDYDTDPSLTNGITFAGFAFLILPYSYNTTGYVSTSLLVNSNKVKDGVADTIGSEFVTYDTSDKKYYVWTVWAPSSAVPIPGAAWLLGFGLMGLIGLKRREA